jgi:hypothetical protein
MFCSTSLSLQPANSTQSATPALLSDVLLFQCVAWIGASALASVPAKLSLADLQGFPHQSNQLYEVVAGNTVALHCGTPYSNPPALLQYYRNKEKLQSKEFYQYLFFFCKFQFCYLHYFNKKTRIFCY